jgi:flagellar hook protein FlgE
MNTTGFKSQRTQFEDLVYNTLSAASGPSVTQGGQNPVQVGTGVGVGKVNRRFTQGALNATGESLDYAIQGDGFFALSGPTNEPVFTRAGSFSLDSVGNLTDPSTGFLVRRTGALGEKSDDNFGFQVQGDNRIRIPLGATIPASPTSRVDLSGSLPSNTNPPTTEILSSSRAFETATGPATGTTLLNNLSTNNADYVAGDLIEITGTNADGTPFSTSISGENATMQDIVDAINGNIVGATASISSGGVLQVTADEPGSAFLSVSIADAAGNVGETEFNRNTMIVTTDGDDGASFDLSFELYDKRGTVHRVTLTFNKTATNSWQLNASFGDGGGELLDGFVDNINFNENGTFALAGTDGEGDTSLEFKFDTIEETQVVDLNFENLTHIASQFTLAQTNDGKPVGSLISVAVDQTGILTGLSSTGTSIPIAQLAIARFANRGALEAIGSNYYTETNNSGEAQIGSGLSGGRGSVAGGQLEASNVDIAEEFTRLIVAQRGFSANARTITVADEVLEELANIIR